MKDNSKKILDVLTKTYFSYRGKKKMIDKKIQHSDFKKMDLKFSDFKNLISDLKKNDFKMFIFSDFKILKNTNILLKLKTMFCYQYFSFKKI